MIIFSIPFSAVADINRIECQGINQKHLATKDDYHFSHFFFPSIMFISCERNGKDTGLTCPDYLHTTFSLLYELLAWSWLILLSAVITKNTFVQVE